MEKVEDRNICKECGGYCCKKSGCDYFVSDFENMKIDYLESILDTGRVSVVASCYFKRLPNNKLINIPVLYLRARNINRKEIDLLSFKTTCASLEEDGCYFDIEKRPSGGSTLIPAKNRMCYTEVDRVKELEKWKPYQNVLERLVKRHTGMSLNKKMSEDAENLFYDVLKRNFTGVAKEELDDVRGMLPLLLEVYPEEYLKAKKRANVNNVLLVKKMNNK